MRTEDEYLEFECFRGHEHAPQGVSRRRSASSAAERGDD
jgi:hypothetical protein